MFKALLKSSKMSMRAIQVKEFGASWVMQLVPDVKKPIPEKNEVLVEMKYSGVNPVDTYIRSGSYAVLPQLPYIPGKDGAGVIAQVGNAVKKFKVGDRVFVEQSGRHGTLAEFAAVHEDRTYLLPENLNLEQGAALAIAAFTAYRALHLKGGARKGHRVLVHGASGSVGQAAVQLARAAGLHVVGTAGTAEGEEVVLQCGAAAVYNHRRPGYLDELKAKESEGFDIVLEMLSNVNLGNDLSLLRRRSVVVVVGCRGEVTISPRLLMANEASIVGCAPSAADEEEAASTAAAVIQAVQKGQLVPRVSKIYTLEQASQAHDDVINNPSLGKLIVDVTA
ncbi:quinone oxidoreductase [Hyalella azteca]|uniref:Quinone oxidoreductase n=1 Tax=Hyalella azteca TaxID=294128 RepID=A0A8B7NG86_HYAAZ|nr:quinone oxidoreductase [Hyalella azteca]